MEQKIVIVTGANNGIGFHMTAALLDSGYRVAGFDLSGENVAAFSATYPDRWRFYRCDVTDAAAVHDATASVIEAWGRIDILVNNACLAVFSHFEDRIPDETRREFEVNYFGYVHMMQAVLPQMRAQGGGIIHNVSSSVGLTGFPGISGYASTKGAIEALTRTLALELEPYGITVNLMHPPLTNTRSAAPLGVPAQVMNDPSTVGAQLAAKIESRKPIVTPNFQTGAAHFLSQHLPGAVGRLMARMTERAKEDTTP